MNQPEKISLEFIERSGGWRYFMRFASGVTSSIARNLDAETVRRYPRAVLGAIFAEAKSGDITGARREFDLWHRNLQALADSDRSLAADLVLVDIHLSVYEDRHFDLDCVERLKQARVRLGDDDRIGQALACNHLCNIALQMGDFDMAQNHAEQAIRFYLQGDAVFGPSTCTRIWRKSVSCAATSWVPARCFRSWRRGCVNCRARRNG